MHYKEFKKLKKVFYKISSTAYLQKLFIGKKKKNIKLLIKHKFIKNNSDSTLKLNNYQHYSKKIGSGH